MRENFAVIAKNTVLCLDNRLLCSDDTVLCLRKVFVVFADIPYTRDRVSICLFCLFILYYEVSEKQYELKNKNRIVIRTSCVMPCKTKNCCYDEAAMRIFIYILYFFTTQ